MNNYFRNMLPVLIALMIVSTFFCVYATIPSDSDKAVKINSANTSIVSVLIKSKTVYVAINGKDSNDGLIITKPKRTIQNAINTAKPGDNVKVAKGTYKENIKIAKDIHLIGNSQKDTIIDGNQKSSCLYIEENSKISINGFTIQNGKTNDTFMGAGVENRGFLDLKYVKIIHNIAKQNGGGIEMQVHCLFHILLLPITLEKFMVEE